MTYPRAILAEIYTANQQLVQVAKFLGSGLRILVERMGVDRGGVAKLSQIWGKPMLATSGNRDKSFKGGGWARLACLDPELQF